MGRTPSFKIGASHRHTPLSQSLLADAGPVSVEAADGASAPSAGRLVGV